MVESYLSNTFERKGNDLNTCIKSLYNVLNDTQFTETKQGYAEIYYSGPLNKLNPTIKYPQARGKTIPVIGYIQGSIPVYLGTTNGKTVNVKQPSVIIPDTVNTNTTKISSWRTTNTSNVPATVVESNSTTVKQLDGGAKITITDTTIVRYSYKSTSTEEHREHVTTYYNYDVERVSTNTIHYDYSEAIVTVLMRI